MQSRGHSLVEMVVVIGLISILLALGTIGFREYSRRYRCEAQTRMLYAELLRARSNAMYQRRTIRVKLYQRHFEVYSSTCDDTRDAAPVLARQLPFPLVCTGTGDAEKGYVVDFDSRGVALANRSLCLEPADSVAAVDSIVISMTRVRIGKKEKPDVCNSDNIVTR